LQQSPKRHSELTEYTTSKGDERGEEDDQFSRCYPFFIEHVEKALSIKQPYYKFPETIKFDVGECANTAELVKILSYRFNPDVQLVISSFDGSVSTTTLNNSIQECQHLRSLCLKNPLSSSSDRGMLSVGEVAFVSSTQTISCQGPLALVECHEFSSCHHATDMLVLIPEYQWESDDERIDPELYKEELRLFFQFLFREDSSLQRLTICFRYNGRDVTLGQLRDFCSKAISKCRSAAFLQLNIEFVEDISLAQPLRRRNMIYDASWDELVFPMMALNYAHQSMKRAMTNGVLPLAIQATNLGLISRRLTAGVPSEYTIASTSLIFYWVQRSALSEPITHSS
jgi:hypothetical protein